MKKLLIDKGAFQAFVFNLILLLITLFLGNYYLTNKINILNNNMEEYYKLEHKIDKLWREICCIKKALLMGCTLNTLMLKQKRYVHLMI